MYGQQGSLLSVPPAMGYLGPGDTEPDWREEAFPGWILT